MGTAAATAVAAANNRGVGGWPQRLRGRVCGRRLEWALGVQLL
eukprot:COSAG01_NODE_26764_length_704_cov_0.608264_1_plen_42_part_10